MVDSTNDTFYNDTALDPATAYCYAVSAYDAADNVGTASAQVCTTTAAITVKVVWAVNCAGDAYTANDGTVYSADEYFQGGNTYTTGDAIAGTADDILYQSERWGLNGYGVPVSPGTYDVVIKLAEIYWDRSGRRIFDVEMEGVRVIDDLDIFSQAGHDVAYDVTIPGGGFRFSNSDHTFYLPWESRPSEFLTAFDRYSSAELVNSARGPRFDRLPGLHRSTF